MSDIIEMILSAYGNERFYDQKKAEYLIRFIPLLMVYLLLSIVISQMFSDNGYSEVLQGLSFAIILLIMVFLIYGKRVEWAVNVLIVTGLLKGLMLVREPVALHFNIYIFIMLLVTAVVHVEKYQLYFSFAVFNGALVYRMIMMAVMSTGGQISGVTVTDYIYTIFGGLTLTVGVLFLTNTIDREIHSSEMLERASETDTLTRLPNRRRFENLFVKKFTGYEKCILLMDLDHFKRINDSYGHQKGDEVLIEVAGILRDSIRNSDAVFRWGGEEFIIILRGVSEALGCVVADRIRKAIELHDFELDVKVTVSIGMLHIGIGASVELLNNYLRRADRALYRAKDTGRNRVVLDHKFKLMPVEITETEEDSEKENSTFIVRD